MKIGMAGKKVSSRIKKIKFIYYGCTDSIISPLSLIL